MAAEKRYPDKVENSMRFFLFFFCFSLFDFDDLNCLPGCCCFVRFLLFVKKGYRDAPYHNWYHAFSVFHFSYLAIKNLRLVERGFIS